LVDGTYELFRAWFGAPPARNAAGMEVGATRGLAASLISLLRTSAVTHIACAFDHVIESFRNELFDGYKTGDGLPEALTAQFELAERAARALGIVVWPMVEVEADDALATAAARFAEDPRVEQVVLCSPDKDLAQCVRAERVVMFDRLRRRRFDENGVREKFGVAPASIPDWLALVGDDADGIPGIPRWGARTASTLLARYGHIESIPHDAASWDVPVRGAATLAKTLAEHASEVRLYKRLATLRTDVPLAEHLDDLQWRGAPRAELEAFCEEVGDSSLFERVVNWRN
jgi:5'-3' exonuclease